MAKYNVRDERGRFTTSTSPQHRLAKALRSQRLAEARNLRPVAKTPSVTFGSSYHTAQIYSMGFEFALTSRQPDGYHQATTWAYCKDFFHDAVWAMVNNTPWSIWGFKYTPGSDKPLDMENCTFLFRNTQYRPLAMQKEFHAKRAACQEFLNGFEAQLGFEPTQIFEVPHDQAPCWLVVGDRGWQHAPPMVGLFTLLIRLGFMHTPGETFEKTLEKAKAGKIKIGTDASYAGHRDCSYIAQSWSAIQKILEKGLEIFHPKMEENYPASLKQYGLHNNFGPVAFTKGTCKRAMPYWYRDEIWK